MKLRVFIILFEFMITKTDCYSTLPTDPTDSIKNRKIQSQFFVFSHLYFMQIRNEKRQTEPNRKANKPPP